MTKELYVFIAAFAWPVVALIALIYVWRTDAIGKLTKITAAAQDMKTSLANLIEAQEKLSATAKTVADTAQSFDTIDEKLKTLNERMADVVADVNSIRDQVDAKQSSAEGPVKTADTDLVPWLSHMERAWEQVNTALVDKFGWFDKRSTAAEAYAFAHGNRRTRISYDVAEEIGVLHSSIKSYRRRKESLSDWLTQEVRDDFIARCRQAAAEVATA